MSCRSGRRLVAGHSRHWCSFAVAELATPLPGGSLEEEHVVWGVPMRDQNLFGFEARDKPWQATWGVPETVPWIEGLWFVREGSLIEGDWLLYGIDNVEEYE